MGEYLTHLTHWDWLALAALLLILEVFGAGGYLLWIGIAAGLVATLDYFVPNLSWLVQFLAFGVLAVLTVVFWWYRQRNGGQASEQPGLNMRGHELLGRVFRLHQPIVEGRGKIKVGDGLWLVSGADLPVNTEVKVVGQEGVVLKVEATV